MHGFGQALLFGDVAKAEHHTFTVFEKDLVLAECNLLLMFFELLFHVFREDRFFLFGLVADK